jgi:hypothetical protein
LALLLSGSRRPASSRRRQFANAGLDMLERNRGNAQPHEPGRCVALVEEAVARFDQDAARGGCFGQCPRIGAARTFQPQRGSASRIVGVPLWQEGGNRLHQPLAPLIESTGKAPHQRLVMAERQEQRHGALVVGRRVPQHEAAQRPELGD